MVALAGHIARWFTLPYEDGRVCIYLFYFGFLIQHIFFLVCFTAMIPTKFGKLAVTVLI